MSKEPLNIDVTVIPADQQEWINHQLLEDPTLTKEEMQGWFLKYVKEFKNVGYDKLAQDADDFYGAVQGSVNGEIMANISVPATDVNMMLIGAYPIRPAGNASLAEIVGYASLGDGNPEAFKMSCWDTFTELTKIFEPLISVNTGVSYFPDDKKQGMFEFTAQKATDLSRNAMTDWISSDHDEKLAMVRANAPHIPLGVIGDNTSTLLPSKDGKANYVNTTDLKRIIVNVVDYKNDTDKNGREWAMYLVIDGTFALSPMNKSFAVWVDPYLANKIAAGPGSYLEIVGYVSKGNDGKVSMTACFVHPKIIKEMPKNSGIQKDAPAAAIQTHIPAIQMVTHPDGA